MTAPTYTGANRRRTSSARVRVGDALARWCITAGGFLTIVSVALVCGFLVWVVLPLFTGSDLRAAGTVPAGAAAGPVLLSVDPYRQVGLEVDRGGEAVLRALGTGIEIERRRVAAVSGPVAIDQGQCAFADADGGLQLLRLGIEVTQIPLDRVPVALASTPPGSGTVDGGAWYERAQSTWRRMALAVSEQPPVALGNSPVRALDLVAIADGVVLAALTLDGRLELRALERRTNPFTDAIETDTRAASRTLAGLGLDGAPPDRVLLSGIGDNVYLLWNSGRLVRLDTRDLEEPTVAETLQLLDDGAKVTACAFLLGRNTLLVGDDRGRIRSWFRTKPASPRGSDGAQLDRAHEFQADTTAVLALAPSHRSRLFAALHADGTLAVGHATSERIVATAHLPTDAAAGAVAMAPKDDGVLAAGPAAMFRFDLDPGHPEFTVAASVTPVWYEGYAEPMHAWQSTGASDDFEPKFGLWPLIFGTLKATLYCLLFGVPIALLAAIYTSEFLHPRRRARVKPLVESMASLPSVVLGFLAALVFAPVVEAWLPTLLASCLCVPFCWLVGAQLLQLLPGSLRLRAERARLILIAISIPVGLLVSSLAGGAAEQLLFGGDFRLWLSAPRTSPDAPGSAFGGWFFALLPPTALGAAVVFGRTRWLGANATGGLLRLLAGAGLCLLLAAALGGALALSGIDLRGTLVDTYVQRNALVVGFVMGFAVVPIVYTIAEDALVAVPEHLRAASLGTGATPWQTAVRIVLPTAMSGIFSAVMVGLGRAVGETMVVLMAAGNTPILELNPFNGFRTLSANIAVELPEAVRDSTHYRMLYLAALVLFAMTFVLNTVAELVRQRFRRRAFQL